MTLSGSYIGSGDFPTPIEADRQLIQALLGAADAATLTSDSFVVTPGTGLAVNVSAGKAVLKGRNAPSQGSYFVYSTAAEAIPWEPAGVLPRIDSLLLIAADAQYGTVSGAGQGFRWVIATGTPNASPVALSDADITNDWAEPGAWARVANVLVNPGDTSFTTSDITPTLTSSTGSTRVMHRIHEATSVWPVDGSYIMYSSSGGEHTIGWGNTGQVHSKKLYKRFKVEAGRAYEIFCHISTVDANQVTSTGTGIIRIRYKAAPVGNELPLSTDTLLVYGRSIARTDNNNGNMSIEVTGHLNNLTPGYYMVHASLEIENDTNLGMRCYAPWYLMIKDIGPAFTDG